MSIRHSCILYQHSAFSSFTTSNYYVSNVIKETIPDLSRKLAGLPLGTKRLFLDGDVEYGFTKINQDYHLVCVATNEVQKRIVIEFLTEVSNNASGVISYQGPTDHRKMDKLLKEKTAYYNDPKNDKLQNVKSQIDDVRNIILENIEKVIERGEKIDVLIDRTEALEHESIGFLSGATGLRRRLWWKNCRMAFCLFFALLVLVLVILMIACKPNFSECKKKN